MQTAYSGSPKHEGMTGYLPLVPQVLYPVPFKMSQLLIIFAQIVWPQRSQLFRRYKVESLTCERLSGHTVLLQQLLYK